MTYKKLLPTLLMAFMFTFLLSACAQTTEQENTPQTVTRQPTGTQQLIGGQTDEGGCLIGAGYQWCKSMNKCVRVWEESCADFVPETLADIKTATNIKFSDPADIDFQWKVRKTGGIKNMDVKGKFSTVENIKKEDYSLIGSTMLAADFKPDLYNTANGINGTGTDGYKKANLGIVCLVSYTASQPTQGMTEEQIANLNRNVNISCGILPKS